MTYAAYKCDFRRMQPSVWETAVVFLCECKSTLFGLPKVDAIRNHWLRFVYNTTAWPKCSYLCNAFYRRQFCEPIRVQGWLCTKAISFKKRRVNSDFAMIMWRFWISDCKGCFTLDAMRKSEANRRWKMLSHIYTCIFTHLHLYKSLRYLCSELNGLMTYRIWRNTGPCILGIIFHPHYVLS